MRQRRHEEEEGAEVNLVPIMNLVLILIPLLLLSVVFLQVVVIPVSMSAPSLRPPEETPKVRLRVVLLEAGIALYRGERRLPAEPGCEAAGVTLCAEEGARSAVERYPWHALYNAMLGLKAEADFAERVDVELVAGEAIPFSLVVRTMDVLRHQRVGGRMPSERALSSAPVERDEAGRARALFPQVSLGLPSR